MSFGAIATSCPANGAGQIVDRGFAMSLRYHEDPAAMEPGGAEFQIVLIGLESCGRTRRRKRDILAFDLEEFYRKLTAEAPDAIIYADAEGLIRFWNAGAERIFGFSQFDALGNTLDIIIPQRLRQRHWEGYARTIRTGVTRYGAGDVLAVPAIRKDGLRISVEFTILPFTSREGQVIGIAAILRDVSIRFREINDLREKLVAAQGRNVAS
jgi:PAS domain S-box-containing protein